MWDTSYFWVAKERTDVLYGFTVSQRLLNIWQISVLSDRVGLWVDVEVPLAGRAAVTDWLTTKPTD